MGIKWFLKHTFMHHSFYYIIIQSFQPNRHVRASLPVTAANDPSVFTARERKNGSAIPDQRPFCNEMDRERYAEK